ncbi:MAG: glycyl-radical enzyme activating protein [Lachnospiraceae bacterium]|nr:glycyl-radical enzyme activating protein [Lachnospiraceae bacterium]
MSFYTHLQKYSIHDGEGIRTTLFWKGCPLSCAWCHNPETRKVQPELMDNPEKCTGCASCVSACPAGAVYLSEGRAATDRDKCLVCGKCVNACPEAIREIAGTKAEPEDLLKELLKDRMFYEESGGGVTFSGGEVLSGELEDKLKLAEALKENGISLFIDTCGFAPWEKLKAFLPFADAFLYDIKMMDEEKHQKYTGAGNRLILDNLERLSAEKTRLFIRIPVISGVNADEEEMNHIAEYLFRKKIRPEKIHLIPYHTMGASKYSRLSLSYDGASFSTPQEEELERFRSCFGKYGFHSVKTGG